MSKIVREYCVVIDNINTKICKVLEFMGINALFLIMVVTFFDVLGSKLFRLPIFGAFDIVMLAQIVATAFAAGSTLVAGRHIRVELFLHHLPRSLRMTIICVGHILSFGLFVVISWNLFRYGYSLQETGEISPTANIALFPFAYGIAIAVIPICIELFLSAMRVIFSFETKHI